MKHILALTLTLAAAPAFATTYYVNSATGSNTNNGTAITTPFATLQKGADSTAAGDTVYVLPGNGYGGGTSGVAPLVISISGTGGGTGAGGSCTNPITFSGYPGLPKPVIAGTRADATIKGTNPLSCIVVNGFELAGWNPAISWVGASINAGLGGTGWGTNLSYNAKGLFIAGATGTANIVHHITVTNNVVHDFPMDGISINYADYVTAAGNVSYGNALYSGYSGSGISLYEPHNIDAGTGTKIIVSSNKAYANLNLIPNLAASPLRFTTSAASGTGSNSLTFTATTGVNYTMAVIEGTNGCIPPGTIVNTWSGTTVTLSKPTTCAVGSGDAIVLNYITDGEGVIIDNNSNSQSDAIAYVGRTLVTNNIAFNNGSSGLECGPTSNNCDVTFNTNYQNETSYTGNSGAPGEISMAASTGSNILNNIVYALSGTPNFASNTGGSGTTWGNNVVFGGNNTNTTPGTANVVADPLFVSPGASAATADFHLQAPSPAYHAGSLSWTRTTDYAGAAGSTGGAYDIGAYQWGAVPPCTTSGTGTLRTPQYFVNALSAANTAGAVTEQLLADLTLSLSCQTTGVWAH